MPVAFRPKGVGRYCILAIPLDIARAHSWLKPGLTFKVEKKPPTITLTLDPSSNEAKIVRTGNILRLWIRDIDEGVYDIEVKDNTITLTKIEEGFIVQATKSRGDSVRTTIPAAIARQLGIKDGDKFKVKVIANRIIFEPLNLKDNIELIPIPKELKEKLLELISALK